MFEVSQLVTLHYNEMIVLRSLKYFLIGWENIVRYTTLIIIYYYIYFVEYIRKLILFDTRY